MPVLVRTLYPFAICEAGRSEAIDRTITMLMEVILSLKEEHASLDQGLRQAAIKDAEQQIAELSAYRAEATVVNNQPSPHQRE
jgi:hypothetical protein